MRYSDVITGAMVSQIASLTIVYSTVYSGADQRKHQSSASLALVWAIHRWLVNSPHKWPVTRKMFPFDDIIMNMSEYDIWVRGYISYLINKPRNLIRAVAALNRICNLEPMWMIAIKYLVTKTTLNANWFRFQKLPCEKSLCSMANRMSKIFRLPPFPLIFSLPWILSRWSDIYHEISLIMFNIAIIKLKIGISVLSMNCNLEQQENTIPPAASSLYASVTNQFFVFDPSLHIPLRK